MLREQRSWWRWRVRARHDACDGRVNDGSHERRRHRDDIGSSDCARLRLRVGCGPIRGFDRRNIATARAAQDGPRISVALRLALLRRAAARRADLAVDLAQILGARERRRRQHHRQHQERKHHALHDDYNRMQTSGHSARNKRRRRLKAAFAQVLRMLVRRRDDCAEEHGV